MTAINPTPMATVHIGVSQDVSPSPPLTKNDVLMHPPPLSSSPGSPVRLSQSLISSSVLPSPPTSPTRLPQRSRSREQLDCRSDEGISSTTTTTTTTTLRMPIRIKAGPPSSVPLSYLGHDHGTPLSDIGEEESTPGSKAGQRSSGYGPIEHDSLPQSPLSPTPSQPSPLGHKSRQSIQSLSEGSDVSDWESFEPSKMMTGRLAADVARDDDDDDDDDDADADTEADLAESQRTSIVNLANGEADEMAILNAKAERILANARQRLTSMEDNLTKARHSIFVGDSLSPGGLRTSPGISEIHQPAGGLYRSISLASRKTKPLHLVSKTQQQVHSRGLSDTISNNNKQLKALSMVPEPRASSAQEYRRRYESPQPPTPTVPRFVRVNGHSPTSSRSMNSPVREDEEESPSTVKTSPESPFTHGLGINPMARETKDDISMKFVACSPSPPSGPRTVSSASNRSVREQVSDLKERITNLQTKARADKETPLVYQSSSTPSRFTNSPNPEQWYASAPGYNEGGSPLNANAGIGWSPSHDWSLNLGDGHLNPLSHHHHHHHHHHNNNNNNNNNPVTPQTQKFLDGEYLPSTGETSRFDIRTDVNTPNLANRAIVDDDGDGLSVVDSIVPESLYEDAAQGFDDQDEVAASEEEQIYLNEVLEESLQEIEPDVPDGTEHFVLAQEGAERHEDRLDAFDYENMFLHSALGNFGRSSYRDSESSDTSSVTTDRAAQLTPTADRPGFDEDEDYDERGRYDDDDEEDDDDDDGDDEEDKAQREVGEDEDGNEQIVYPDTPDRTTTPTQFDVGNSDQATPTRFDPPKAPWARHPQRSQSVESVSTVATFATATEGGGYDDDPEDEVPEEILQWGNGTAFPAPPFLRSPLTHSAPGSARPMTATPTAATAPPLQRGLQSPIRGVGPIASPVGGPVQSNNGILRYQRTPISSQTAVAAAAAAPAAAPPAPNRSVIIHHRFSPISSPRSTLGRNSAVISPTTTLTNPAINYNINTTNIHVTQMQPPPASSSSSSSPAQPPSASSSKLHFPHSPNQPHPANTEILMESLIKLADPDFRVQDSGVRFADIDKDLVLCLLRAVGNVCDSVLKADKAGRPDEVNALRGQLDLGRRVLEGALSTSVSSSMAGTATGTALEAAENGRN